MSKELPVFFHIPKNAGTYVYNYAFWSVFINTLKSKNPCNLEVIRDGVIAYRLICNSEEPLDSSIYKRMNKGYWRQVELDQLNLDDLNVFFIEVCDSSFFKFRDEIYSKLDSDVVPYEFLLLREPYLRIQSLYSYIQSSDSNHEDTNNSFGDKSFIEYLNSSHLEGSWLIRALLDIPNSVVVQQEHYDKTCKILDQMHVSNMSDVRGTLDKVFYNCYGITDINNAEVVANKTQNKIDITFSSLDEGTRIAFLNQAKWDIELYNKYN